MRLDDLIGSLGDWIMDAALVTQARGHDARGPLVLWCNSAFCALTGERHDQIIGQPLRLPPPDEDSAQSPQDMARVFSEAQPIQHVLRDTAPDGRPRWLDLTLRAIPDEAGAPLYWLGTLRDISAQRTRDQHIEAELQHLRAHAQTDDADAATNLCLANSARLAWDAKVITDKSGAITWVNAAFTRITGYSMEEALGQRPGHMLRGANSDPATLDAINAALRERKHVHVEVEYLRRDNTHLWAEIEVNPQFDTQGQFIGFVGKMKDITERREKDKCIKDALKKASESVDLLHTVTAEAPAVLFQFVSRIGQKLQMTFVSPESERAFGLAPNTFSEQPDAFWRMIAPEDLVTLQDSFVAAESIQCPVEYELCLCPPMGTAQWFTLRARPRRIANGDTQWTGSMVDTTKEHAQRIELKTSLELNASVLDASPFGIMSFDAIRSDDGAIQDFKLVQVNRVTAQTLGRETETLIGQSMSAVFPGVRQSPSFAQYCQAMESGEVANFEIFYTGHGLRAWLKIYATRRGDNSLTLLINNISGVKEAQNAIEQALAAARQSAEDERLARSALIASDRRLRAALEISDVWVCDVDFSVGAIQGDFARDFALPKQGNLARKLRRVHPDDRREFLQAWTSFAKGVAPEFEAEFRFLFLDDSYRWVRAKGTITEWSEAGEPLRATGAMIDIDADRARTERLRAALRDSDLALMESEALSRRLDLAINASGIGVWEVDNESGRLTWTQAMYTIYGREADGADLTYLDWVDALHPDDRESCQAFFLDQQSTSGRFSLNFRILRYGEERHIRCLAQNFEDRFGRSTMIGVNWDVTEQVHIQQHLEERRKEAEAANGAKSQFLANMSHEIRTPMNGVLGMAGALAGTDLTASQAEMVTIIQSAGESLMTVLNDILDFSKIEAGRMELESTPFSLSDLAGKIGSLHALKAKERNIAFEVICTEASDQQRLGDPHRVMQILHNLVSNAIKFTERGFVRVRLEGIDNNTILLEVSDSGIGLSSTQQSTIFQHFTQADASTTRQFGGTGLGLAVVRGLAEAMNGTVSVESSLGNGAIFRTRIAAQLVAQAPAPAPEPLSSRSAAQPGALSILAAEDNTINRFVLRTLLAPTGATLTFAVNGMEALELWRSVPFDLILMDISMPIMDGKEALKAIRGEPHQANSPTIPIIAVTANAFDHQVTEYRELGFDEVVPKPIEPAKLMNAISTAMLASAAGFDDAGIDAAAPDARIGWSV